jgi:hypothetical protein
MAGAVYVSIAVGCGRTQLEGGLGMDAGAGARAGGGGRGDAAAQGGISATKRGAGGSGSPAITSRPAVCTRTEASNAGTRTA